MKIGKQKSPQEFVVKEDSKTLQTIYEAVKEKLDIQLRFADSVDTKASVLIGFNGVIIAIVFTRLWPKDINLYFFIFIVAIIFLMSSIGLAFRAYATEPYRRDPDPRGLKFYSMKSNDEVIKQITDNLINSYEENEGKLIKKAKRVNWSFKAIFMGLLFLGLSQGLDFFIRGCKYG